MVEFGWGTSRPMKELKPKHEWDRLNNEGSG